MPARSARMQNSKKTAAQSQNAAACRRSKVRSQASPRLRSDLMAQLQATDIMATGAYARSDIFERRRKLMDAWGRFCAGEQGAVVQMLRG